MQLAQQLIAAGEMTDETLAHAIGVRTETMRQYIDCVEAMPLNRQARLALFVIATCPRFTRQGNQLREQIAAAIAFEARKLEGTTSAGGPR